MEVVKIYESNPRNVVATLRLIADQIEKNEFSNVIEAVLVTNGDFLEVFGIGEGDAGTSHLLLATGQRKLENAILQSKGV